MKQHTKVTKYIEAHCANYDTNGLCLFETNAGGGRVCPFFVDIAKKCNYAEKAVIPNDPAIEALYYTGKQSATKVIYCEDCKKPYTRTGNRQKRCTDCAERRRKSKRVIYDMDHRKTE